MDKCTDLQIELDGITLHVDFGDGLADWILRRVDIWDAQDYESATGRSWPTEDAAFAWWESHPDALRRERDIWLERQDRDYDDYRPCFTEGI